MLNTICHSEYSQSSAVQGVHGELLAQSLRSVIKRMYIRFFNNGDAIPGCFGIIWRKTKIHRNKYSRHSNLQKFFV